ncbi:MAG: DNA-processing protein DprA [Oscillospiraceae bacterium]|jgi:DNA processing protein|nr:DNA-processing protein DprA [Oscillospiraceae bacterium]
MMQNDVLYWIWLSQSLGFASYKAKAVLKFYDVKNFYSLGPAEWRSCGFFCKSEIKRLESFDLKDAENILKKCSNLGYDVITINDFCYPKALKNISNPPCVLYTSGNLMQDYNNNLCIAIIGTRNATDYGSKVAYKLSFELAMQNVVIVSGGALGIDSYVHKGALEACCGKTISVLGCGINYDYPVKNKVLRKEIAKKGLFISEHPPDAPPVPKNFPLRNRIISGISNGVVVVEAPEKSGALITANLALEQNKDVFSVPGNIGNKTSKGTNLLIKFGAKPVLCTEDILEEYKIFEKSLKINKKTKVDLTVNCNCFKSCDSPMKTLPKISQESLVIFEILSNTSLFFEEICEKTSLPAKKVSTAITELEILGLINNLSGRKYSRNNEYANT